jgi:hypothetical protein
MAWAGYYVHKYGACYYENWIKQSIGGIDGIWIDGIRIDGILA